MAKYEVHQELVGRPVLRLATGLTQGPFFFCLFFYQPLQQNMDTVTKKQQELFESVTLLH